MQIRLGRYVFGVAAMAFGILTLTWHQIHALGGLSHPEILVYVFGAIEIAGGLTVMWERTLRYGAITLLIIFSITTIYEIPPIFKTPLQFFPYGDFFEQFSILVGAVFIFATTIIGDKSRAELIERVAYMSYGVSVLTYALYQLFYLPYTASLVPRWIPPDQMFWAIATTITFALAAFALLSGRSALLASVLLTIMLILFGLLIWVPACANHPHVMSNWTENASNLAMAGSAWIVADYLKDRIDRARV